MQCEFASAAAPHMRSTMAHGPCAVPVGLVPTLCRCAPVAMRLHIVQLSGAHNAVVADLDGDGDPAIVSKEFAPAAWNKPQGGPHADWLENRSTRPER